MSLDLDSSRYSDVLKVMIKCLSYSPLAQALIIFESVPLVHLSKAYSSSNYSQIECSIDFEIDSNITSISKARFSRMLGFSSAKGLVHPESFSSFEIINMFYQMGYITNI